MNLRWTQRFDGNSIITGFDIEYKNKSGRCWTRRVTAWPAMAPCAMCPACALRAAHPSQTHKHPPVHKPLWLLKGGTLAGLGVQVEDGDPQLMGSDVSSFPGLSLGQGSQGWSDLKPCKGTEPRAVRCL